MSTIFSKIIAKEIPAEIVWEDDEILAFKDVNPQAPVHILIIPKIEIPTANDLDESHDKLMGKMIRMASSIAKNEGIAESGYRLIINCNQEGGQSVYHIHIHLIGGKQLLWP